MLLSLLRCGQYISNHSNGIFTVANWKHVETASYNCAHSYTIELLSMDPLAIYINNFLSDYEIDHLLELGKVYHKRRDQLFPPKLTRRIIEKIDSGSP